MGTQDEIPWEKYAAAMALIIHEEKELPAIRLELASLRERLERVQLKAKDIHAAYQRCEKFIPVKWALDNIEEIIWTAKGVR